MHGHRYVVEATFVSEGLDLLGRVVDFGVIKEKLGNWIDDNWDHNTILWDKDNKLGDLIASQTNQRVFYLPYNPTAENLANYLLTNVCPVIFSSDLVKCVNIKLSETPNCYASAS
jgi:6-pyruvoyltetrahydropterin/6-carboxytetrahydropterin synthase